MLNYCAYVRLSAAGRAEFVQYLPEATQGVVVQPLGSDGVVVVGTDTLRGLSRLDQVSLSVWQAVARLLWCMALLYVSLHLLSTGTDTVCGLSRLDQEQCCAPSCQACFSGSGSF
jgi:hypothetical protein